MPHSVKKALEIISQKGKVSQFFQETQFPETDVFSHGASKRADRTKGLNTGLWAAQILMLQTKCQISNYLCEVIFPIGENVYFQ